MAALKRLKILNRAVVAQTTIRRPLTDRAARARVKKLAVEGKISEQDRTNFESALRQSRRENAEYQAIHVHDGLDVDAHVLGGAVTPFNEDVAKALKEESDESAARTAAEKKLDKEGALTAKEENRRENKQSAKDEKKSQRTASTPEPKGESAAEGAAENTADSENLAQNTGPLPFVGPRFNQTERMAAGKVNAARRRDKEREQQAWDAFEREHPEDAAAIDRVWNRAPDKDISADRLFALALDSWLKKTISAHGRQRRRIEVEDQYKAWLAYRKQWRPATPYADREEAARAYSAVSRSWTEFHAELFDGAADLSAFKGAGRTWTRGPFTFTRWHTHGAVKQGTKFVANMRGFRPCADGRGSVFTFGSE